MTSGTVRMTSVVAALVLLLGAGSAQAQCDPSSVVKDGDNALMVLDLEVAGECWDVTFVLSNATPLYGPEPESVSDLPIFGPFDAPDADQAIIDIAVLLGANGVLGVGADGDDSYDIGVAFSWIPLSGPGILATTGGETPAPGGGPGSWEIRRKEDGVTVDREQRDWSDVLTYARFDPAETTGEPPAPTINFSADPEAIGPGASSTLTWDTENADSCTGSVGSAN